MHLGPLCMQLRAPISFFLLFGANSSPEKVQHFLVSPNSIKIVPNTAGPNHPPNGSFRLILLLFHISFPNLAKNLGLSPKLF